jgi:quinol-cytochrome oxidoreductase complex cytochrome b subunit
MRLIRIKSIAIINAHLNDYPTPIVGYLSSFGSLSGVSLVLQIITGILLASHYNANISLAFLSLEHIIRDVNDGWLFRYMHSNGASIFFFCLYLHIYNNFYSEAEDLVWLSGVALYLLAIVTAFVGYTLPWGQISYWGATVITNIFTSIPVVGQKISLWLWGGFSIANPTLNRFFSLHYCIPFIMVAVIIWHLSLLHIDDSTVEDDEYIGFLYYYLIKDLFIFFCFITVYTWLVFFHPNLLSHPDNYLVASFSNTPSHLVPEWYFWPFYAVLRSVPNKLGGLIIIIFIFVDIFLIENINADDESDLQHDNIFDLTSTLDTNQTIYNVENEEDIGTFIVLFYLGGIDTEEPYPDLASLLTLFHFFELFDFDLDVDEFVE